MTTPHRAIRGINLILLASALCLGVLGAGFQNQVSKTVSWGVATDFAYRGTLDVDKQSALPVGLGQGNLAGSYPETGMFFLAPNFTWTF